MKNIILFLLINFVCLGYANSQTREKGNVNNPESSNDVSIQLTTSESSESVNKSLVKKILPITLVENGVWLGNENQQMSEISEEKTVLKKTTVKKTVPVILVDKGVWVADKNLKMGKMSQEETVMLSGKSPFGFSTGNETIDSYIMDSANRYNIDPLLIYAQMHQESGFKLRAMSYKGARGLMQLMPATAMRFGVKNIYDPKQNIDGGIKYMRWLLDKFNGDESLALAGYNAGEGAVIKYGNQIPPYEETRNYVKKIIAHYKSIKIRIKLK
jgi:hypothetical protein